MLALPGTLSTVLGLTPGRGSAAASVLGLDPVTMQTALRYAIAVCVAAGIGAATHRHVLERQPRSLTATFISGASYAEKHAAARLAAKLLAADMSTTGPGIALSPAIRLPRNREIQSVLVVGRPRYGKSSAIQYVLDGILARPRDKLVVYDSKGDVAAGWPSADVIFLAPHDTRSWGWAVGRDVLGETGARELATALIQVSDREPNWTLGGQEILIAAIRSLQAEHGTGWSWGDLDEVLDRPDKALRQVALDHHRPALRYLTLDPETDSFDRTAASYVSTAMAPINRLVRPLAQAWSDLDPRYQISLREWLLDEAPRRRTIILQAASHLPSISAAWITAALEMMARFCVGPALADSTERRVWYILDEFSTVPKIAALPALLAQGPSKGVCVLLACQNLELVEETYGNILTQAIIQNMDAQALFRLNAGPTSEYLTRTGILKTELRRSHRPATSSAQGHANADIEKPEIFCLVTPHELATLPRGEAFVTIEGSILRVRWPKSTWIDHRPGMIQAPWVTAQAITDG
ncbi:type IV secretion system DNA-binding domain-containing protein [Methylobacterium sp.]|uniref:type IV secretion system DNA-binding domain-containing protein n=1 Tax=Methylobacterium sp. TaxID=409 RepID=UPI003B005E61